MKVLHVIPSVSEHSGGPGQAIIPMCRALRDKGVDVLLATTDAGMPDTRQKAEGTGKEVPTIFFPVQLGQSLKYSRPFAKWLYESVSDFDVVHIHAVFNHACVAAARACREKGVPYIVRPLGTLDPWSMKQKRDRKSTRLNSSHDQISYAVFCLKKKKKKTYKSECTSLPSTGNLGWVIVTVPYRTRTGSRGIPLALHVSTVCHLD